MDPRNNADVAPPSKRPRLRSAVPLPPTPQANADAQCGPMAVGSRTSSTSSPPTSSSNQGSALIAGGAHVEGGHYMYLQGDAYFTSNYNNTNNLSADNQEMRGQNPPTPFPQGPRNPPGFTTPRGRRQNANSRSNHILTDRQHSQRQPEADTARPIQRSNKIYESQLLLKELGYPFWNPRPIPHRTKGVCIGDVGIINPDGGFDFLFNICPVHENLINPPRLPDGFVPIYPPLGPMDVSRVAAFSPLSHLAIPSISKTYYNNESPASGLILESSSQVGAILAMPDGVYHEKLFPVSAFDDYFTRHVKNWYKFVKRDLRRQVENGDIRLVVECYKTTTWGMAVFTNPPQMKSEFKFRLDEQQRMSSGHGCKYVWEHSEIRGEVQVGPGDGENDGLGTPPPQPLPNQCLFIRTLNIRLDDDEWKELHPARLAARCQQKSSDSDSNPGTCDILPSRGTGSSSTPVYTPNSTQSGRQQADELPEVGGEGSLSATYEPIPDFTPSPPTVHPSKIINKFLLSQRPNATMAMTRDRDWYSLLSDQDMIFPDSSTLVQRVQIHNDIYEDNGIVRLRLKGRDQKSIAEEKQQIAELSHTIDSRTSLLVYLFGHIQEPNQSQILQNAIEDLSDRISMASPQPGTRNPAIHAWAPQSMAGHPDRLLILDDLLGLLQGEFVYEDMQEESIPSLWKQLNVLRADEPSPNKIQCLLRLGNALQRRYSRLHLIDDLEDAIHCYDQAKSLSSTEIFKVHHQQLDANLGLASSIYQRYLASSQLEDLITLKTTLEQQMGFDVKTMLQPFEDQLSRNKVHGGDEGRDDFTAAGRNIGPWLLCRNRSHIITFVVLLRRWFIENLSRSSARALTWWYHVSFCGFLDAYRVRYQYAAEIPSSDPERWAQVMTRMMKIWGNILRGATALNLVSITLLNVSNVIDNPLTRMTAILAIVSSAVSSLSSFLYTRQRFRLWEEDFLMERWIMASQHPSHIQSIDFWGCLVLPLYSLMWSIVFAISTLGILILAPLCPIYICTSPSVKYISASATTVISATFLLYTFRLFKLLRYKL